MKAHYPPGPRDWFFGLTLGLRSLREPLAFLQEMARDYGDIAYVRVGPYHSYVINHPDLIREVCHQGEKLSEVGGAEAGLSQDRRRRSDQQRG
jgi:hypothetical protein